MTRDDGWFVTIHYQKEKIVITRTLLPGRIVKIIDICVGPSGAVSMRKLKATSFFAIFLTLVLISLSPVWSQDMMTLINEINAVENKLSKIIENEAVKRKAADDKILEKMGKPGGSPAGCPDSSFTHAIITLEKRLAQNSARNDSTALLVALLANRVDSLSRQKPDARIVEIAQMLERLLSDLKTELTKKASIAKPQEPSKSAETSKIDVNGVVFLHYTSDLSAVPSLDNDGFSIERAYVDVKAKMTDRISGRITVDLDPKDSTDKDMFLKFAYAEYIICKNSLSVRAGQQETHWIGCVDKAWKYRSIEKSLSDYNKVLSSADIGLSVLYVLPRGYGDAVVQFVNGNGYKNTKTREENNFQKDLAVRVSIKPMPENDALKGLSVSAGFQYKNDVVLPSSVVTGLAAFDGKCISAGCELLGATKKDTAAAVSAMKTIGYSIFGDVLMWFHKNAGILFRYDSFDPDNSVAKDGSALVIAGARYLLGAKHTVAIVYQKQTKEKDGVKPVDLVKCVLDARF